MSLSPALASKFPENVTLGPNEVVAITGGSGFLGQHIIRVLNERANGIREIRVIDIKPYTAKLDFKEIHQVKYYKADIAIEDQLDEPFNGATCVIHCAAVVDIRRFSDRIAMKSTNFIGTTNVAFKCRQWNVPKLILTSSVDAVIQHNSEFHYQSEAKTELPEKEKKFLMGYYAFTKAQSEAIVIVERNRRMANGKRLKTAILRPTVLYGELDPYYVPQALKAAKATFGYLLQPMSFHGDPVLQSTYAGNAAWAHVLAIWKLNEELKHDEQPLEDWRVVDGQTVFINDDTRPLPIFDFMKPFLSLKGFSTLTIPIPFYLLFVTLFTFGLALRFVPKSWRGWFDSKPLFPTAESLKMVHKTIVFDRIKSTNCLEYKPIYSEEKALELSSKYYKDIVI